MYPEEHSCSPLNNGEETFTANSSNMVLLYLTSTVSGLSELRRVVICIENVDLKDCGTALPARY